MGQLIDETGNQYGRLKVIQRAGSLKGISESGKQRTRALWLCQCSCGNTSIVTGKNLRNHNTKSCGCLKQECLGQSSVTHGRSNTKEHQTWLAAKNRCFNPSYKSYSFYSELGMCDEWINDFQSFYDHLGPAPSTKHSVDRIDNERGYFPGNVRWATYKQQRNNQRSKYYVPRALHKLLTEPITFVYTEEQCFQ